LQKNPDIDSYVRRSGAELGIFATQTNRGDIQIILRPDEVAPLRPWTLLKPMRPPLEDLEKMLKEQGMKLDDKGKEFVRQKYRRRPMASFVKNGVKQPGVMDEVEDGVKDMFAEHQLKIDPVPIMQDELNDLSGAKSK
jgi:hypothetical protein